jgi:hypothetical protein
MHKGHESRQRDGRGCGGPVVRRNRARGQGAGHHDLGFGICELDVAGIPREDLVVLSLMGGSQQHRNSSLILSGLYGPG